MPSSTNLPLCLELQEAVVAALGARVALRDVPIIGRRKTNIVADVEEAVNSIAGIALVVLVPLPVEINPNSPGPYVEKMEIRVRVIENQAINETLPSAAECVEEILCALHHYTFPQKLADFGLNLLVAADRPVDEIPDNERVLFDVIFTAACGYRPRA